MLMVVDSQSGQPVRRWLGSATAVELAARLRSTALALTPGAPGTPGQEALARASAAESTGDRAAATEALQEALVSTRPGSLDHGQAAEALVLRLSQDGQWAECLYLAREELGRVPPGTALATVVATGLSCALELPESDPGRIAALQPFENRVGALAKDPSIILLADDRSSLFETVVDARKARGDLAGAHATAQAWAEFLEATGAAGRDARGARGVRLPPALGLPRPRRAAARGPDAGAERRGLPPGLQPPGAPGGGATSRCASPPWRWSRHGVAEKRVYGPRTLRVLLTKAEAEAGTGDSHAARVTLARAEKLVAVAPAHPAQRPDDGRHRRQAQGALRARRPRSATRPPGLPRERDGVPRARELARSARARLPLGHRLAGRAEVAAPGLRARRTSRTMGVPQRAAGCAAAAVDPQPVLGIASARPSGAGPHRRTAGRRLLRGRGDAGRCPPAGAASHRRARPRCGRDAPPPRSRSRSCRRCRSRPAPAGRAAPRRCPARRAPAAGAPPRPRRSRRTRRSGPSVDTRRIPRQRAPAPELGHRHVEGHRLEVVRLQHHPHRRPRAAAIARRGDRCASSPSSAGGCGGRGRRRARRGGASPRCAPPPPCGRRWARRRPPAASWASDGLEADHLPPAQRPVERPRGAEEGVALRHGGW